MTNLELQTKLKTFPDAAEIYTEGGLTQDGDVGLDDDGDVSIGPFLDDDEDEEDDDLDLDPDDDNESED